MALNTFTGIAEVKAAEGQHLGYSEWLEITQDRIDKFAEATGDYQWIHVDAERAKDGPFGATIAHGYLTLSLASYFLPQIAQYEGFSMAINYGVDKVRFINPVKCGACISAPARMRARRCRRSPTSVPACRPRCSSPSRSRARTSPPA